MNTSPPPTPSKRGRGRPRKIIDTDQPDKPDKPKRGRGRPRKIKGSTGRPRKDNSLDETSTVDPGVVEQRSNHHARLPSVNYTKRLLEETTFEEASDTPSTPDIEPQSSHAYSSVIDLDPLTDEDDDEDDDDSDDDDFAYESDLNDDDLLARYMDDMDKDELEYLVRDQNLVIDDGSLPTLYYPNLKNRVYAFMRTVTIQQIYKVCAYTFLLLIVGFLINQLGQYKSNIKRNGYCPTFSTNEDSTNHSCIPCPPNGYCAGGELFCHPLYRPHRSMSNKLLNTIWPTPQKCARDPTMLRRAKKMQKKILDYLARRQGDHQCKQYRLDHRLRNKKRLISFEPVKTNVALMVDNLKTSFALPVARSQEQQVEVDGLIELAVNGVKNSRHVFSGGSGDDSYLTIDYAKYSFVCWCWMIVFNAPVILTIGGPCLLGAALLYMKWTKKRRHIKAITNKALDLLREQRRKHVEGGGSQGPGCSSNYLRLHVLPETDYNSVDIWKRVLYNLQQHPGIRKGHTDENGEILQYFEWL